MYVHDKRVCPPFPLHLHFLSIGLQQKCSQKIISDHRAECYQQHLQPCFAAIAKSEEVFDHTTCFVYTVIRLKELKDL